MNGRCTNDLLEASKPLAHHESTRPLTSETRHSWEKLENGGTSSQLLPIRDRAKEDISLMDELTEVMKEFKDLKEKVTETYNAVRNKIAKPLQVDNRNNQRI